VPGSRGPRSAPVVRASCSSRGSGKEGSHPLPELIRSLAAWRPQPGEAGQGLAEYALILGLIAIVAILSLIFLGDTIANLMSYIGDTIDRST
jgi:Flp pilus assembly pilin Flp